MTIGELRKILKGKEDDQEVDIQPYYQITFPKKTE